MIASACSASVSPRTVAWIESPFQLLSLIEATYARHLALPVEGHLRGDPGMYRPLVRRLDRHPVEGLCLESGARPATVRRRLRGSVDFAVGDLCSGQAGVLLTSQPHARLVVLDDGSSTLVALANLVRTNGSLVRPRSAGNRLRSAFGIGVHRAVRARMPGRIRVVSGLSVAAAVASAEVPVVLHGFGWTRSAKVRLAVRQADTVILGSALASDGLISVDSYRSWLDRALDTATGSTFFVPHRRDAEYVADLVRRRGGLLVSPAGLPIELVAAGWHDRVVVVTLPSTAALTLPVVQPRLTLDCRAVSDHWWTGMASPSMRQLVADIGAWSHSNHRSQWAPDGSVPRAASTMASIPGERVS